MNPLVDYVRLRLHKQNKNFIAAVCGPTGSGKSYSALRLAELIEPGFSVDQVCFTPQEFMELLNSGKLKRGSVIILDEAGVAANSRNFQSATNKALHFVAQTFRSSNYCVIYCMPDFGFLDLGVRKLCHVILSTRGIDYKRKLVYVKPLMIENNPQTGKVYMKYPRYKPQPSSRRVIAITKLAVHKPNEALIEAYEARKMTFNKKLQADILRMLHQKENGVDDQTRSANKKVELSEVIAAINADKEKYLIKNSRGKLVLNRVKVATDFKVGLSMLDVLRQVAY